MTAMDVKAQFCGYYYSKPITITGAQISGGPHVNFPVLISHTDPALATAAGKVKNTNGYDIIFTDNAGNPLAFQLERYNSATGQIVAWVRLPSITNGTNTVIHIRYGNETITTDQSVTTTWSSGYAGVWHFNNNVNDHSGNGIVSTNNGSTSTTGKIGDARNFVDPDNWVELTAFPNLTTSFTITGWIYSNDVNRTGARIFVDDGNNTGGYGFSLSDEAPLGRLRFYSRNSTPVSLDAATPLIANNTWYHVAAVADIAGSVKRIYINGVEAASGSYTGAWGTDTGNASIGGEIAGGEAGNRFHGNLDEIRVATRALPAAWLLTEYRSQNQPTTTVGVTTAGDFYTVGTEVAYGDPTQFGSNTWNVYGYTGNNFETYHGYYVHNTLTFDSRDPWGAATSPSAATGYSGCTIPNDNHSFRYKRRGFPCGYYQIDMPNHDDNVILYVDGVIAYQQNSWYNNIPHNNVWQGYLGPNSRVEMTIREFGGDSHAGLTFTYLHGPSNNANQTVWHGGTSTNWETGSNWCSNVPNNMRDAYIPGNGVTNFPIISGAMNRTVRDLTIAQGATLSIIDSRTLTASGNWTNNGTFSASAGTTVTFGGSSTLTLGGTSTTTFANLRMNNSNANALTLQRDITVTGLLTLTNGDIITGANMVILNNGATVSGVSNNSYVSGIVRKIGNSAFTFPVGKAGYYAPISITAPNNAAHFYTAEYFFAIPTTGGFSTALVGTGIAHVSHAEYWTLTKSAGASDETVRLSWNNPRSGGVTQTSTMRLAGWNGAWSLLGATITGGSTNASGSVNTDNDINVDSYQAFTLASSTSAQNPLPVELVTFTANLVDDHVLVSWQTSSEKNNDYFTVKKSTNGKDWRVVGTLPGSGTTLLPASYSLKDTQPLPGLQYYQLTQTDYDGASETFPVIALNIQQLSERGKLTLYPNPTEDDLIVRVTGAIANTFIAQVIDVNGKVLIEKTVERTEPGISVKELRPGVYNMIVSDGQQVYRAKFVRK